MMKRAVFRVGDAAAVEVTVDKVRSSVPYFCKRCQNRTGSVKAQISGRG